MGDRVHAMSEMDDFVSGADELPYSLRLDLTVTDRETVQALCEFPVGNEQDEYALAAIKIGVLALRHASTRIDTDSIQQESTRLLQALQSQFDQYSQHLHGRITGELKNYFDPESGRFNERVQRLVKQDGELEQLLRRQIGSEDSQLVKTLIAHVGEHSPLMRMLGPDESTGVLAALRKSIEEQLGFQRDRLLEQFSLDKKESALSRLRDELTTNHSQVSKDLREKIHEVVQEFSFDVPDSSISRLNRMLVETQGAIHKNLTLDEENSPLARLKREMFSILTVHGESNQKFQEEVKLAMAKLMATRAEAERSTRHGLVFEQVVCEFVTRVAQNLGDVAAGTGSTTGLIRNCKVGDCVVELGPDSPAPGAKIVIEAKEDAGYTLPKACEEIKLARDNRGAQWGLFVFSKKSAPGNLEPFARYGNDVMVIWDADDPQSDVFLKAGLMVTRALCIRASRQSEAQAADFEAMDGAILEIKKRAEGLDEIRKSAETIQSASGKILERVRINREALDRQVEILRDKMIDLKQQSATAMQ